MGLREKAVYFRKTLLTDRIGILEDFYEGKKLTRRELLEIKEEFRKKSEEIRAELDRKLIDMRTLFEVGKELNSSLDTDTLIQTVLFTVMGQYRISDIAVFLLTGGRLVLKDRKGFEGLPEIPADGSWTAFLAGCENFILPEELSAYPNIRAWLEKAGAAGAVPFRNQEKLIGLLLLGKKPDNAGYGAEEKEFGYTLASLSGIAIDNARLYGELKRTVARLDRKLAELSTLYEISKVINSSDDRELVLSLLTETVSTGFGVKKCVLFILENGVAVIRKTVGLAGNPEGGEIKLPSGEQDLLKENRTAVLDGGVRAEFFGEKPAPYLFVPLAGPKSVIGGLIVLEMENYKIEAGNEELTGLFSIIASQAAPQIAMTSLVMDNKRLRSDPFTPLLENMRTEIERAKEFGAGVLFSMLHLKNFSKYIELHGADEASERFSNMSTAIRKLLPQNAAALRYSSNRVLFILPGMMDNDFEELKDPILRTALEAFPESKQIDIGADLLQCGYPASGDNALALLKLIE